MGAKHADIQVLSSAAEIGTTDSARRGDRAQRAQTLH